MPPFSPLYLKFLNCDEQGLTAAEKHHPGATVKPAVLVFWKDLNTGVQKGPDPELMWEEDMFVSFQKVQIVPSGCLREQ